MKYSNSMIQAINRAFGWFDDRRYTVTYWVGKREFSFEVRGYDRLRETVGILDNLGTQYLIKEDKHGHLETT
jgi:hypothetical protein